MTKSVESNGRLGKLLQLGMGAIGMTEAGVRRAVQELRLPRDATSFLVEQFDKRKADVLRILRNELQAALKRLDVAQIARQLLKEFDIEVTARVRLTPRQRGARRGG